MPAIVIVEDGETHRIPYQVLRLACAADTERCVSRVAEASVRAVPDRSA